MVFDVRMDKNCINTLRHFVRRSTTSTKQPAPSSRILFVLRNHVIDLTIGCCSASIVPMHFCIVLALKDVTRVAR